ncbi:hypothetical protein AF332_03585 [Sporosarcina globispora]|uniref:Uncharacterized protein n=1 Tax=Sporosarcina globispora TaxID=1459 RepID=A0A0M0G982_SPOGL|nr:hypothetical protein AF332_03585 [Sporosarcina globispora]
MQSESGAHSDRRSRNSRKAVRIRRSFGQERQKTERASPNPVLIRTEEAGMSSSPNPVLIRTGEAENRES